jgi:DNA-binding response OmpR family regulator
VRSLAGSLTKSETSFDIVLLDLSLPDSYGLKTVRKIYEFAPNLPIVILSGLEDREFAIEVVHKGAQDYLVKGEFDSDILGRSIHYEIERAKVLRLLDRKDKELQQANQQLEQRVKEDTEELEKANLQLRMAQLQLRRYLEEEEQMNELNRGLLLQFPKNIARL